MFHPRAVLLSIACLIVAGLPAVAQTAITKAVAPIYLRPEATLTPLRTAAVGTTLKVLGSAPDWVNVEFEDPQFGRRVGWVKAALVTVRTPETTPMDLSVTPVPAPLPAAETAASATPTSEPARTQVREGFWFNIGLGFGTLGCEDCGGERLNGLSGGLSMGGTIGRHVLLGFGTSGFAREDDLGEMLTVGNLEARVRVYPAKRVGFFLTGGAGLGTLTYAGETETGLGITLGVGWDIRVGRNVSLTPFWNGFAMANDNVDANVGQLGIGVTIH